MNYILDNNEKQFLQLLQTAREEKSFDKNAYACETKYSSDNIHYAASFSHRDVYCKMDFYSKCGSFSFCVNDYSLYVSGNAIEKKYCTTKSHFFGLFKETPLDVNHPVVDAALTVHKEIMQKQAEKNLLKRQKTWDKLLSKSQPLKIMNLQNTINENIKTSMKSGDSLKLNVFRAVKNAISNAALQSGNIQAEINDSAVLAIVRKQISQREDSLNSFIRGNRNELAEKEKAEIEVLQTLLPPTLSEEVLNETIQKAITELSATSKKDFGKVLKRVSEMTNNAVDNKTLSAKLSQILK